MDNPSGYSGFYGRGNNRGRGSYSTRGRGFHQQFNTSPDGSRPTCHICDKYYHSAAKCYKRFDESFQCPNLSTTLAVMKISDEGIIYSCD